ncbi:right-handed parallel beta-helix repeat-containing protein [Hyalangium rubrum]|uniref:Right-handed parallel beta-helix repeat-containing protein n=1 Tax=Hyalangium rubrum TaxID=3103134 RepID=A0ABU5HCP2_9BACT|nr:right-handed parallel beta-helix repeat-containing protein [Hyalangium sp. s54d21]MDY7231229.1 right-handed parallel beta-helix repeat-containing protein [Hyalangium sp. s54d21]
MTLASPVALAADGGIGAQNRPDLSFADIAPTRIFHVAVTGQDGNSGTAASPWRTINYAVKRLRPGEAAYVHAGTYYERVDIGSSAADGTASAPIHLMGAPGEAKPVIRGGDSKSGSMLRIQQRRYWVVTGFNIQAAGSQVHGVRFEGARYSVVRDSEVSGGTGPVGVVFYAGAADLGFLRNKVHHYTWGSNDSHGMLVLPDTARILIQGNESWANGGDSFQCQGPDTTSGTNLPTDITVENNRFHEDRENAVDLKTCDRVTLRGNKFYGYRPASSAPQGAAVVIHCSARRILVEGNRMWNNGRGLTLGGVMILPEPVTDVIIRRNLVFDSTTASGGSGDGLRVGTSRRVRIHHNTLAFLPVGGITVGDGDKGPAEAAEVYNNIVYATPRAMDIRLTGTTSFKSDRNLAYQPGATVAFRVDGRLTTLDGWRSASGQDRSSSVADPLFVSEPRLNDFYTQATSPARDKALPLTIPSLPLSGTVCGTSADLGILESCL